MASEYRKPRPTDPEYALLRRQVITEWLIIGVFALVLVIGGGLAVFQ